MKRPGNESRLHAPLVGCCGWRESRAKYFEHFSTVELQDVFYEPPSIQLASKWRELAPPDFQFCIKAWQLITHTPASPTYRRLKSKVSVEERGELGSFRPTEQVWLAWERTEAVAHVLRARVILFQCPASFTPARENVANLRAFFGRVERTATRLAWEPRGSWPPGLLRELCEEFDLIDCVDPFERQSVHGELTYWRLHGRGGYSYRYSAEELTHLEAALPAKPSFIFFNNIWMREDALRFQALLQNESGIPQALQRP